MQHVKESLSDSSGNVRNSCEKEIVLQVPQIKVCIKTER